jgi:competence protein ComEC
VAVLDVGQGLSVLIIAPDGEAALFDGGPTDAGPAVLADLKKFNVSHLNLVFLSHPHADHEGGEIPVLKTIPVDEVITNGVKDTTSTFSHWLDAVLAINADYEEAGRGSQYTLGGITLLVESPPAPRPTGDLNHGSLVLHFQFGQRAFQLEGDADKAAESVILAAGQPVRADVLQVGHHCSAKSSGITFLRAVAPAYSVCPVGANNPYGHPHAETISALEGIGTKIFRSDLNGTILFTTDGNTLTAEAEK